MIDYILLTLYLLLFLACFILGVCLAIMRMFGWPWKTLGKKINKE